MPWDPCEYQKFSAERSRPAGDLLAQVEFEVPGRIVDLGCGTGWLARAMAEALAAGRGDRHRQFARNAPPGGPTGDRGTTAIRARRHCHLAPGEPVDLIV